MSRLLLSCLLCIVVGTTYARSGDGNPLSTWSDEWNDPRFLVCNTARHAKYMSQEERDVIYVLNMARMAPALFCKTVVEREEDVSDFLGAEPGGSYFVSLKRELNEMKPLGLIYPDSLCTVSARCHATSSGPKGYVGHDRQSAACRKKSHYMGECCHYGPSSALEVVVLLLQDDGVKDLGHRKICLGNYTRAGVAIASHKVYDHVAVLDFY